MRQRNEAWNESGQTFRWAGWHIETTKPAKIKLAYGDERLEEIRRDRLEREAQSKRSILGRLRGKLTQRISALG